MLFLSSRLSVCVISCEIKLKTEKGVFNVHRVCSGFPITKAANVTSCGAVLKLKLNLKLTDNSVQLDFIYKVPTFASRRCIMQSKDPKITVRQ